MKISHYLLIVPLSLYLVSVDVQAAVTGDSMDINIHGTYQIDSNTSCTFNQGEAVDIDFGAVKFKDGGNNTLLLDGDYTKSLPSSFTCTGNTQGLLQMNFTRSNTTGYYNYQGVYVLNISTYGVGIIGAELLVNGSPQSMNQWFDVNPSSQPNIQLKLVQPTTNNDNNIVNGDTFNATGTLTLAFN